MPKFKREPLYALVRDDIRKHILSGELRVGTMLASEIELARESEVAPGTMRKALDALEAEGFLDRRHGHGTIVISADPAKCPHCGAPLKNGKA